MVDIRNASYVNYLPPLLPLAVAGLALAFQTDLYLLLVVNLIAQVAWFIVSAHIPAVRTGIMSYVDLAWPWGLCIIGLVAMFMGSGDQHLRILIGLVYLAMGLRTGLRSVKAQRRGAFRKEFGRYEYQKQRWAACGKRNVTLAQQIDIAAQWFLNATLLAAPAFVLAQSDTGLTFAIFVVLLIWALGFVFETAADCQKKAFVAEAAKHNRANAVCTIGLWRFCRHPNYFGEWLVWTALAVAACFATFDAPDFVFRFDTLLLLATLFYVSRYMYIGLTRLTGIEPAEYYSLLHRPGYEAYRAAVPAFWPRWPAGS